VKIRTTGAQLGVLPVIAAAIPSVSSLASKALTSVIGIFDPGKKRDANRKARADMWGSLALAGSITAARRVIGGAKVQFTALERSYYAPYVTRLQSQEPKLYAAAVAAGALGIPEPGSDQEPPMISAEDQATLQREIDAYRNPVQLPSIDGTPTVSNPTKPGTTPPTQAGGSSILPILAIAGALLARKL
jgi:hypothetical protein